MEPGAALGPYQIDRELGSGGMGKVYAAALTRPAAGLAPGTTVALKVVHPHLLETEGLFKRFLREGQVITQKDDGTWASTRVIDEIQIPSSVLYLVNARVADLSEEERDLLDVASCCGFEFDPALVAEALSLAVLPTLKRFGQIERRHRLVRAAGRRYVFDHHQVQEALYASLFEQVREHYHAAIAEAFVSRTGAAAAEPSKIGGALCVELCEHLLKGGRGHRAARYLESAQLHLSEGYLHAQSAALGERALAVPGVLVGSERVDVLRRQGQSLESMGRRDEWRKLRVNREILSAWRAEFELDGDAQEGASSGSSGT